jgi:hypothetical protein
MIIMSEIIKWTFIIVLSAPLPILLLSSLLDYIKEKVQERYSGEKKHLSE